MIEAREKQAALPPAQVMAVAGINSFGAMGGGRYSDQDRTHFNPTFLRKLAAMPPFQSFIASIEPGEGRAHMDVFARERAAAIAAMIGADAVLDRYEQWHQAAGKWPNETPYGEPL